MTTGNRRRSIITRRNFLRTATGSVLGVAGVSLRPARSAAGAAAPAVVRGKQDIIMGIGTDVKVMDLRIVMGGQAEIQILHVQEPLTYPNNEGKQVGILTSAWQPVSNPPGWRFKLRPGIKFQNGEPFNARSVKYTVDSYIDSANRDWVHPDPRTVLGIVKGVQIEDDLTVFIVTKTFYRALPIALNLRPMLPPKYGAEKGKEFGVSPYGTGHYRFSEYRPGSHLYLEADANYHGHWEGPAKNATLTFRFLKETATRVAALEAGEVHLIDNFPPDAVDRVRSNPNLAVLSTASTRINGMFFHCNRKPFNDLKARLAVVHAIDNEAIVKGVMGGLTEVAKAPFPPGTLGTGGETFRPLPFDLKKARQYFSEAGLTTGTKIKVGGPVGRYVNDKQVVTAVAGMIAEVGFDPQIEQLEFGTYWPKVSKGEYDMFYVGWAGRGYDPIEWRQIYTGWSEDNAGATHFVEHNKRVVELYELANKTLSQQEAESHYKELSRILWDNQPVAYMFYEPNMVGVSRKLKGWTPRHDTYTFLWSAYLG